MHLPSPSYWPIVVAAGLPLIGYGLIYTLWLCVVGGLLVLGGLYGWVFEPVDDPDAGHGHGDDHHAAPMLPGGVPGSLTTGEAAVADTELQGGGVATLIDADRPEEPTDG